ncbi:MAG: ABC transporter ATP-binding protein [Thermoproteota archaeon]
MSKVSKVYYRKGVEVIKALDQVDLKVVNGEFVTILGPSGSGKTTLLNILGALDRPTSGTVILDNSNLSKLSEAELVRLRRQKVGFVFQQYNLIPTISAIENVEVALAPSGMPKKKCIERSRDLLKLVGLEKRMDHLPAELSGGEQQRVAIARAFANEPKILLMDEPTGVLDTKTGREIMDIIRKANKENGKTIVVVTHAGYARGYSDRLLFMRDGKLYEHEPRELENQFEDE